MIIDALLFLIFSALFVVFGSNVIEAFTGRSIWARNTVIEASEHKVAFGVATITSVFFSLVTAGMAVLMAAQFIRALS